MAPAPITHMIFDLDGTLLNTLDDLAAAGNYVCGLHGWPTFTTDQYRYKVGNGMSKLVERFMPAEFMGDALMHARALAEFRTYYDEHKTDRTSPYPGIMEALDELRAMGVELAVLTNKDHAAAVPLVERFFGTSRFSLVQGRVDAFLPKPTAPITRHVLAQLEADPAGALYIGDSDVDVQCGHNAGMRAIGVSWGFRGRSELEAAGADAVIDEPGELVCLVREL